MATKLAESTKARDLSGLAAHLRLVITRTAPPIPPRGRTHLRPVITRTALRLRQGAGTDPGPPQTSALATIDRHGPLTPTELARVERIQRPTATRIVARLEEGGLVNRVADPEDGRSCTVGVSAEGRQLMNKLRTRKNAYLARRIRKL